MSNTKKILTKTIFGALLLMLFYYMIAVVINYRIYNLYLKDPWVYLYYIPSAIFHFLDIELFTFTIPDDFQAILVRVSDWKQATVPIYGYRILIDTFLPSAWLFKAIPYYSIFALVIALIYSIHITPSATNVKKDIRGAAITTPEKLSKILNQAQKKDTSGSPGLYADPIVIPGDLETRHCLTAGSTGTGKSVMLCQLITGMVARKSKMVIYDRKGELYAKFGGNGSILWNPHDKRFCGWNIFTEFDLYTGLDRMPTELTEMANSLFSTSDTGNGNGKHFYDGAASIFKSGCCYLKLHKMETNKDLYNFFSAGAEEIAAKISTLPKGGMKEGESFLAGEGDVAASYLGCLMDRTKAFQPLINQDGAFSIRRWITNNEDKRILFLSSAGGSESPILTMLIDIVGRGILSMTENPQRRVFMVIDEFSSLPPLKTIRTLLKEGRSKGASLFLTTQTMAAVQGQYGKNDAEDIMGLCNTLFVFRTNEPGQSEYFSRAFGDAERIKDQHSCGKNQRSTDIFNAGTSTNVSEQNTIERIFLPGELQALPNGCAVVKIADFPVAKVTFRHIQINDQIEGFIEREVSLATEAEIMAAATAKTEQPQKEPKTEAAKPKKPTFFRT